MAYLRPETAQGMFINFANVLQTTRKKPPFGIAQVGKSFRNEITPQNFVFRTREFEQMEMEYFVPPAEAQQWFEYWLERARSAGTSTSASPQNSCGCATTSPTSSRTTRAGTADVEFLFPWGWDELEGIANRADFDLTAHAEASGESLDYFDQQANERYVPHVIEPAAGATRTMMAFLLAAYDRGRGGRRGPHRAARCTGGWPPTRWPCSRCRRRSTLEPLARAGARAAPAPLHVRLRRHPVHRQALPPPGRGRAPRGASPSTSTRSRTTPSPCATATPPSRCGCPSRASLAELRRRTGQE